MKVAFIGCGNLGSALASAMLEKRVITPADLHVVERDESRRKELVTLFGGTSAAGIDEAVKLSDVVILAIKPQDFDSASDQLKPFIGSAQLVISIMAGVSSERLAERLPGTSSIIRSMPNLPAKIGRGMTVYYPTANVSDAQLKFAESVFNAFGESLRVNDEVLIHAATAVSASGPGFVFYLIEAMAEAAVELGFSSDQAALLVRETFSGSVELWRSSGESPRSLREKVTSKGGTTEAGLKSFSEQNLGSIVIHGIRRAFERSRELA